MQARELWPLVTAEREVIRHRHLQSPMTVKYIGGGEGGAASPPSASLKSLLSPTLDTTTRRLQLVAARWESSRS
ncbi:hypothetical protein TKK_0016410 [Trichogramma kaykai]